MFSKHELDLIEQLGRYVGYLSIAELNLKEEEQDLRLEVLTTLSLLDLILEDFETDACNQDGFEEKIFTLLSSIVGLEEKLKRFYWA